MSTGIVVARRPLRAHGHRGAIELVGAACRQRDVGALRGQRECDAEPEAAAAARDQGDAAIEAQRRHREIRIRRTDAGCGHGMTNENVNEVKFVG